MAKGTRFGEIHGSNLHDLFTLIENLPYKIEHKQTLKEGNNWYIIFTLPDDLVVSAAMEPEAKKALQQKEKKIIKKKRGYK